jgi:hypothetical protein
MRDPSHRIADACNTRIIRSNTMNIKAHIARLALGTRDTLTLDAARGALVNCLEGLVWITQDGDRVDHIVGAGDAFRIDRDGPVVVQATRPTRVAIESPREEVLEPWWNALSGGARG